MQDKYQVTIDYYAILGIKPESDFELIRRAWKKLDLVWKPEDWESRADRIPQGADKEFCSSLGMEPTSEEEARVVHSQIKQAYQFLYDPKIRSQYDADRTAAGYNRFIAGIPLDEKRWRKHNASQYPVPANEEAFLKAIKQDAKRYPDSCFNKLAEQPEKIQHNLWELIAAGLLRYESIEAAVIDYSPSLTKDEKTYPRRYLWDTVLAHDDIVNYLCSTPNEGLTSLQGDGAESPLIMACSIFEESGYLKNESSLYKARQWFDETWAKTTETSQKMTESEVFLLHLIKLKEEHGRNSINFKPADHVSEGGLLAEDAPFMQRCGILMVDLLRAYLTPGVRLSIGQLKQQLLTRNNILFSDSTYAIRYINRRYYLPITEQIAALQKQPGSQTEIRRLSKLLKDIEEQMLIATQQWLQLSCENSRQWLKTQENLLIELRDHNAIHVDTRPELGFLREINLLISQSELEQQGAEQLEIPEQKHRPPVNAARRNFASFFIDHPIAAPTASTLSFAGACFGVIALYQHLKGLSPWNWLTTDIGMGTPADVGIAIAAVVFIVLCAAVGLAIRASNNRTKAVTGNNEVLAEKVSSRPI